MRGRSRGLAMRGRAMKSVPGVAYAPALKFNDKRNSMYL